MFYTHRLALHSLQIYRCLVSTDYYVYFTSATNLSVFKRFIHATMHNNLQCILRIFTRWLFVAYSRLAQFGSKCAHFLYQYPIYKLLQILLYFLIPYRPLIQANSSGHNTVLTCNGNKAFHHSYAFAYRFTLNAIPHRPPYTLYCY